MKKKIRKVSIYKLWAVTTALNKHNPALPINVATRVEKYITMREKSTSTTSPKSRKNCSGSNI